MNVEHGPKEEFERIGPIYGARLGRTLTQWEVFAIMVAESAPRYERELEAMRGRLPSQAQSNWLGSRR